MPSLKLVGKRLVGLAAFLIFAVPQTGMAGLDSQSIEDTLLAYKFGKDPASVLERRFGTIVRNAGVYCQSIKADAKDLPMCELPRIASELDQNGQILAKESFDPAKLQLTLASRLHPVNLIRLYENGSGFDSTYARYLIAQRLLRELWPLIDFSKIGGKAELDEWIVPWFSARTPFSFLLYLSRSYVCDGEKSDLECKEKSRALRILQSVAKAIEEDTEYSDLLKAVEAAIIATSPEERKVVELNRALLRSLSDESPGFLILKTSSPRYSAFDLASVRHYLDNLEQDSAVPVVELIDFTGRPCADLNGTLALARRAPLTWPNGVSGVFQCRERNDRLLSISGPAYSQLESAGLLWRFNFYELRLAILSLFRYIRGMDPRTLALTQIEETLVDIRTVSEQARRADRAVIDDKVIRGQMAFLYKYVMATQKRATTLLGMGGLK